jgi:nucleoside-diphosphate-sugar epimerase
MTLPLPQILFASAGTIGAHVAPHLAAQPYALGHASVIALLNILIAQESERAADTLARENDALRALFADAATGPLDAVLQAACAKAAAGKTTRLYVSLLQAENNALRATLIALHEAVDGQSASWARALDTRILCLLKAGADARALVLPAV